MIVLKFVSGIIVHTSQLEDLVLYLGAYLPSVDDAEHHSANYYYYYHHTSNDASSHSHKYGSKAACQDSHKYSLINCYQAKQH